MARDALFAAEERFKQQEDWNLLYVAATRAKEILIVSGVAGARGALEDGSIAGSWYHRLQAVPVLLEVEAGMAGDGSASAAADEFSIPIFNPALFEETDRIAPPLHTLEIDEGVALHTLLERLTQGPAWPVAVPDAAQIVRWLRCPPAIAQTIRERALLILSQPALERFFNPAHFRSARNEMEVVDGNALMRFDRTVVYEDEVWVLDYKRDLLESERAAYYDQLSRYCSAAQRVFPGKAIRAALITADGRFWEVD